jgi:hypothetical protein
LCDFEAIFARPIPQQDQRPVQLKEHEAMMAVECERNGYTRGPRSGILGEMGMKISTTRDGAGYASTGTACRCGLAALNRPLL